MKKVFFAIVILISVRMQAQVNVNDSLALVNFYNAVSSLSWPLDQPVTTWQGVTISGSRVIGLELSGDNLSGNISAVSGLKQLKYLQLDSNNFTGILPAAIGNISTLQILSLGSNAFSGKLPSSFSKLKQLTNLNLSFNQLTGTINVLTGIPLLSQLNISSNQFSGSIPDSIDALSALVSLNLSTNRFTDTLPASIGNLAILGFIDLSGNKLIGKIPSSITNLQALSYFSLSTNNLTGGIPQNIGNMTNLASLLLSHNKLSGKLPVSLLQLKQLAELGLSFNKFSGKIPSGIGNLSKLTSIDLSSNKFSGDIPASIGNLVNLTYLNLSQNSLTDSIPSGIGDLSNLKQLLLSKNLLKYAIPAQLGSLPSPCNVDISVNKFTFSGMSIMGHFANSSYGGQDTVLPVIYANGFLSVATDDANSTNMYTWSLNNSVVVSVMVGDPHFAPTGPGIYSLTVTNPSCPQLTLRSEVYNVPNPPPFVNNAMSIAKAVDDISCTIFPNPALSYATLSVNHNVSSAVITIADGDGKMLWQQNNINGSMIKLPVEKLAAGIYYVSVTTGNEIKMLKLIKQ